MSNAETGCNAAGQTAPAINKKRRALLTQGAAVVAGVSALERAAIAQSTATSANQRASGAAAFGKTLKHDAAGLLLPESMQSFEAATASGHIADWERLPVQNEIRLVNPLAAYPWDKDPMAADVIKLPPFPALDSERLAEEALELYWMALPVSDVSARGGGFERLHRLG